MKPREFRYSRPRDLGEALNRLAEPDTKVLAGGQSLVPLLNLRLAAPSQLVDINRLAGLDTISVADSEVRVGALVRHSQVEDSIALRSSAPLLSRVASGISFRAIRTRGTLCGSVAHADPAAEWPLVLFATSGRVTARSRHGARNIGADELFVGQFETALRPDEMIVEAVFCNPASWSWGFAKFARKEGEFSIATAVVGLKSARDGSLEDATVALGGLGPRPLRLDHVEQLLRGRRASDLPTLEDVAAAVPAVHASADINGSSDYKQALAAAVCRRAAVDAAAGLHLT